MPIVIAPQNQPLTIIKIAADDKTKKPLDSNLSAKIFVRL